MEGQKEMLNRCGLKWEPSPKAACACSHLGLGRRNSQYWGFTAHLTENRRTDKVNRQGHVTEGGAGQPGVGDELRRLRSSFWIPEKVQPMQRPQETCGETEAVWLIQAKQTGK